MRLRRLFSTLVVELFALLPTVRTVCDLACVPAPAPVAVPAAYCTSHESAPESADAEPGDACEHEHRGGSVLVARAAPATDAVLSAVLWTARPPAPGTQPDAVVDLTRAVATARAPQAFSVPLRI